MNKFMELAVKNAEIAFANNEVPVGAVIVHNEKVISSEYNKKNIKNVSIYHAEILAIISACKKLKTWHLDDCELYVTLKPCPMCINAIAESRIKKVYYLLDSNYNSNINCNFNNIDIVKINNDYNYSLILKKFFNNIRSNVSRET